MAGAMAVATVDHGSWRDGMWHMAYDEAWRAESDDQWLAEHSSTMFARLRQRFKTLGAIGGAVSEAETGPFAGAPRNPRLRVGDDKAYSTIREAEHSVAYIATSTSLEECPNCGQQLRQDGFEYVGEDGDRIAVGGVRSCVRCEAESWTSRSRMPRTQRSRDRARKHVL
ncbi:hypothetical protein Cs7R123_54780 [Catellatospora sp. TT07R-123]|uniref:hypothetical protein n=1 Tax=Catellatospora sp. TT07R-123 TaxID=2733863 RepID=UPI001B216E24|nr:hypothetical protein [Catellatospora sp. TT07R-123]GHJ48136.1 hypothetical protein Cs7R123_54780 [Catellatospora sp. TT07R-123]